MALVTLVLTFAVVAITSVTLSRYSDDIDELEEAIMDIGECVEIILMNTMQISPPPPPARILQKDKQSRTIRSVLPEEDNSEYDQIAQGSHTAAEVNHAKKRLVETLNRFNEKRRAFGGEDRRLVVPREAEIDVSAEELDSIKDAILEDPSQRIHIPPDDEDDHVVDGPPDPPTLYGGVALMLSDFYDDNQHRVYCFEEDDLLPTEVPLPDDTDASDYLRNVTLPCVMKHIAFQIDLLVEELARRRRQE